MYWPTGFHVIWNCIIFSLYHQALCWACYWLTTHCERYFHPRIAWKVHATQEGRRKKIVNKCINIGKLPMSGSTGIINKNALSPKVDDKLTVGRVSIAIFYWETILHAQWNLNGLISIKWQCSREGCNASAQGCLTYTFFSKNASRIFPFHNYALLFEARVGKGWKKYG